MSEPATDSSPWRRFCGVQGDSFEEVAGQFRPVQEFIARESLWLLTNWIPSLGLAMLQKRYIAALQQKDLALSSGRVRARELAVELLIVLDMTSSGQWGCDLPADSEHTWALRMVRHPKGSQHPLKHLLLLNFLGQDADTFLRYGVRRTEKKYKPWPCLNPTADHYGSPVISAPRKIYRLPDGRDYGVFACDCGFSYRCPLNEDPFEKARVLTFGVLWEKRLRELSEMPGVSLSGGSPHIESRSRNNL